MRSFLSTLCFETRTTFVQLINFFLFPTGLTPSLPKSWDTRKTPFGIRNLGLGDPVWVRPPTHPWYRTKSQERGYFYGFLYLSIFTRRKCLLLLCFLVTRKALWLGEIYIQLSRGGETICPTGPIMVRQAEAENCKNQTK